MTDTLRVTVANDAGVTLCTRTVEVLDEPVPIGRGGWLLVAPGDLVDAKQAIMEAARMVIDARGVKV